MSVGQRWPAVDKQPGRTEGPGASCTWECGWAAVGWAEAGLRDWAKVSELTREGVGLGGWVKAIGGGRVLGWSRLELCPRSLGPGIGVRDGWP